MPGIVRGESLAGSIVATQVCDRQLASHLNTEAGNREVAESQPGILRAKRTGAFSFPA